MLPPSCFFRWSLPLLVVLLLSTHDGTARSSKRAASPRALNQHALSLQFTEDGQLTARDQLVTQWARDLEFSLDPDLNITAISCDQIDLLGETVADEKRGPGWWRTRLPRDCRDDDRRVTLNLEYAGVVESSETAGIALSARNRYYPTLPGLSTFELEASLPHGWSLVTQGVTRISARGHLLSSIETPSAGLSLIAAPLDQRSRQRGTTTLSLYQPKLVKDTKRRRRSQASAERDPRTAERFLDAVALSLTALETRLGPLNHEKLDFIESALDLPEAAHSIVFTTSPLITSPKAASLTALLAQAFWPQAIPLAGGEEDWRPGLATCTAELLAASLDAPTRARLERRLASAQMSLGEEAELSAVQRYGLLFHRLHRELGNDSFWTSLRKLRSDRAERMTSFRDVISHLDAGTPHELAGWMRRALKRSHAPQLSLANLSPTNGELTGSIEQDGEAYEGSVVLELTRADGSRRVEIVELQGPSTSFRFEGESSPAWLELDPDWLLPRRLVPEELPPSLARSLAAGQLLIIHPSPPPEATAAQLTIQEAYERIAQELAAKTGARAMADKDLADIEFREESLLILGRYDHSATTRRVSKRFLAAGIDITKAGSFLVGERRWSGPRALLATLPQSEKPERTVTLWIPNDSTVLPDALSMLEHADHGWAVIEGGGLAASHQDWPSESATRIKLGETLADESTAGRLAARVAQLTRPRLEGRAASSHGAWLAAEEISHGMALAGLRPWAGRTYEQAFHFVLHDLPRGATALFRTPGQRSQSWSLAVSNYTLPTDDFPDVSSDSYILELPKSQPLYFDATRGMVLGGTVANPELAGLDLKDTILVLIDEGGPSAGPPVAPEQTERDRLDTYFELLPSVRRHNGQLLVIVQSQLERGHFPLLTTYPTLHAQSDSRLAAAHREGGSRGVQRELSRINSTMEPTSPVALYFAGQDLLTSLHEAGVTEPGDRAFDTKGLDIRLRLVSERVFDRNLIGIVHGRNPPASGVIVVGAHHDGPGNDAEGHVRQGASEAAATALMLELAERFARSPAAGAVAFVSFGAEGWGLKGSRLLAGGNWPADWPPAAVINLHAVGHADAALHVIGASREPDLARTLRRPLAERGFAIGPDADALNDENGSDHWPWVRGGVPAVSIFQAEPALVGSRADRAGTIDPETLARLADGLEEAIRSLALRPPVGGAQ